MGVWGVFTLGGRGVNPQKHGFRGWKNWLILRLLIEGDQLGENTVLAKYWGRGDESFDVKCAPIGRGRDVIMT